MPGDIMAEELDPIREVAVHCAGYLRLCCVPVAATPERNVWSSVVNDRECRQPEVEAQPRHEPILHEPKPAEVHDNGREGDAGKEGAACPGDPDLGHLLLGELASVKVPNDPVKDGGPEFQGRAEEALDDRACVQRPEVSMRSASCA